MNAYGMSARANAMFGNNVMNPQQQMQWMAKPAGDASGLGYLKPLSSLFAQQIVSMTEVITGFAPQSKFGVFNDKGEQVFYAFEESDTCQRMCFPKARKFDMHVVDSANQEIIRVRREFRCCAGFGCFPCCNGCKQAVTVESPPGSVIGFVTQQCSCCRPTYLLQDASGNTVLQISGPLCICDGPYACCCENKFTLVGTDGQTEIGAIFKKYRGFLAESFSSADQFVINFPLNLDAKMKAVALAALFLMDFAYFSEPSRRNRRHAY